MKMENLIIYDPRFPGGLFSSNIQHVHIDIINMNTENDYSLCV